MVIFIGIATLVLVVWIHKTNMKIDYELRKIYRHIDKYSVRCALYFPQTAVFIEVAGN